MDKILAETCRSSYSVMKMMSLILGQSNSDTETILIDENAGASNEQTSDELVFTEAELASVDLVLSPNFYAESRFNLDPTTTFYLNEFFSLVIMGAASLAYYFGTDGAHEKFQWVLHLVAWGQTNLFWLLALVFDSELTRQIYYRSAFVTTFIPWVGVPIYLLLHIAYHAFDRDDEYTRTHFWVNFFSWVLYGFVMREYSFNVLAGLYNYYKQMVELDLRRLALEKEIRDSKLESTEGLEEGDGGVDGEDADTGEDVLD